MVRSRLGSPRCRLDHHPRAGYVVAYLTWSYHRAQRLISPDGLAVAPVWVQLTLLVGLSTALMLLFGLILGPFSFSLFSSPESSYELATGGHVALVLAVHWPIRDGQRNRHPLGSIDDAHRLIVLAMGEH